MQEAGGFLVKHYNEMAFMGFVEVLSNLSTILENLNFCKKDILKYSPDVVILVDFAGFNMRIARFAKEHQIKTFYYISPKIWAWNQSRAYKIKKYVDRMFVTLPFEKAFYSKFDYKVDFVGNPVVDAIEDHPYKKDFIKLNKLGDKPVIAILPGSRKQEVEANLNIMSSLSSYFPDYQFVVAAVPNLPDHLFKVHDNETKVVYSQTYDLLANATAAIITSGTATLEAALIGVPQVVCYRTSAISYFIGKRVVKVKYISLVNLLADKEVVRELIQNEFSLINLVSELEKLLSNEPFREMQKKEYNKIKEQLGAERASEKAAKLMYRYLK